MLKENEALHEYVLVSRAEEQFLKQNARVQWMQLGDQNNSFFHKIIKVKASRNMITHLWDE